MQFRRTTSRQLTWWSNMKRRLRRTTTTPFMELQHAPMLRCDHCDYHSFRKKTQPSWRLREPLAQRRSTVGVGGGPVSLCVMLTSTTSLLVQLYRQTFSARKVRCFPTPPRISFRSGGGEKPMWRENSPNPWYNWNSFRWCEILRKGGVNTPVNEAGYSEPWQT